MWVAWAVLCDDVEVVERGAVDIRSAGINTIEVDDLPIDVSILIAAMFTTLPSRGGEEFIFGMELRNPQGQMIDELEGSIKFDPPRTTIR